MLVSGIGAAALRGDSVRRWTDGRMRSLDVRGRHELSEPQMGERNMRSCGPPTYVAGQAAVPVIVSAREKMILDCDAYDHATSFNLDGWGDGGAEEDRPDTARRAAQAAP
jgi:hypothetical protein